MVSSPASKPLGRGERTVVVLLFFATLINYLDRLAISIVPHTLQTQFSSSSVDHSRIVFFFIFGYTLGQKLFGKLIDRLGTRRGLLVRRGWTPVAARKAIVAVGPVLMLAGLPVIWAASHVAALAWISVVLFGYAS